VCAALGIDVTFSGRALTKKEGLFVADQPPVSGFLVGPRVGVDYATPEHRDVAWRLALPNTRWVSQRKTLRPWHLDRAAFLAAERQVIRAAS
jgi:DNA-3-methyladenine glycosylase